MANSNSRSTADPQLEWQAASRRYRAAMHEERRAWRRVQHRLPGTPQYDHALWLGWATALQRVANAGLEATNVWRAMGNPPDSWHQAAAHLLQQDDSAG